MTTYRKPGGTAKKLTLDELCGNALFIDSATPPREWRIRVFTLQNIGLFYKLLGAYLNAPISLPQQVAFMKIALITAEPTLIISVRRLLGMSDFSARWIAKNWIAKDVGSFVEAAVAANSDTTLEKYLAQAADIEKKKTMTAAQTSVKSSGG